MKLGRGFHDNQKHDSLVSKRRPILRLLSGRSVDSMGIEEQSQNWRFQIQGIFRAHLAFPSRCYINSSVPSIAKAGGVEPFWCEVRVAATYEGRSYVEIQLRAFPIPIRCSRVSLAFAALA